MKSYIVGYLLAAAFIIAQPISLLATPAETVRVFKYDGTLQCNMGMSMSLHEMGQKLDDRRIEILSSEKRIVPVAIPRVCGAPTGWANVYEIPASALKAAQLSHNGDPGFSLWLFEADTVFVYKYDGTLQCGMGKEVTLEEMENDLVLAGIKLLSSRKSTDGFSHMTLCGASTGRINIYEIESTDYPKAASMGFNFLGKSANTVARESREGTQINSVAKGEDVPWPW